MKILRTTLILSIIFCLQLFAQEETLIGDGEVTHGGFGGPVIKYTQIKGEPALLVGGRGGWIINHTFVIGGGGYGLVNDIQANIPVAAIYSQPFINFGYGGLELEYINHSDRLVHFTVYTLIGAGSIIYRLDLDDLEDLDFGNDEFFVLEPAINLELNIISFFRINAGASYRYISGLRLVELENKDLVGFSGVITLKFGKF